MATARSRSRTRKKDWRPAFLKAFAETGLVIEAAEKAKVGRSTVYDERQRNESFALAWAEIEEWTTEEMEQEARRRAVIGVEEPVFHRGEVCGAVRKYSDTLLIFMLKARKPEVYRERFDVQHSGEIDQNVKVEIPDTEEFRDRLDEVYSRLGITLPPAVSGNGNGNGHP